MSTLLADTITEIEAFCIANLVLGVAVPPQINFLTRVNAGKGSFTNDIQNGRVVSPCFVLSIGDFDPDTDWACDDWALKRMPVTIDYVMEWGRPSQGRSGQKTVGQAIMTLAALFDDPVASFTNFDVMEPAQVQTDADASLMKELFVGAATQIIAARACWTPGFQIVNA